MQTVICTFHLLGIRWYQRGSGYGLAEFRVLLFKSGHLRLKFGNLLLEGINLGSVHGRINT